MPSDSKSFKEKLLSRFVKKKQDGSEKRTILFVNPQFQTRFSLYVCSWIFPLSLVYPAIFYALFDFFFEFSKVYTPSESLASLRQTRNEILWYIIALQVVFMALVFLISVYVSHKVAGPLYKLHQAFEHVRGGKWLSVLKFRKADHFQELADDFTGLMERVRSSVDENTESLSTAIARIENVSAGSTKDLKTELDQALGELRKVRERLSL